MLDEKDTSAEIGWYYDKLTQKTIKALKENGFDAEYVPDRGQALTRIIEVIPPRGSIGCGDSVTLHQIGFFDWLKKQKDHDVFNPFFVERSDFADDDIVGFNAERFILGRQALTADVFCTGTNAITVDGKLVNIDANGNRVAPMIFGPGKVILVSGINKIVKDVDEAIKRIKDWAAPLNTKRHVYKHGFNHLKKAPCYVKGTCQDCRGEVKCLRITTIIDGWHSSAKSPINYPPLIIIVGELLGI